VHGIRRWLTRNQAFVTAKQAAELMRRLKILPQAVVCRYCCVAPGGDGSTPKGARDALAAATSAARASRGDSSAKSRNFSPTRCAGSALACRPRR
jgi:hypothetical protein